MKKKTTAKKKKITKKKVTKKALRAPKPKPKTLAGKIQFQLDQVIERVENLFSDRPKDITAAIKKDHEALRNFLDLLKDTKAEMTERRRAYTQFAALLKSHTEVEEKVVYQTSLKLTGREMHIKLTEGFVEHKLAEDLMTRIEKTTDAMDWSAHANVLSEIVEHHLKEEERDLLPLIRKTAPAKTDQAMLTEYLSMRASTQTQVTDKNAGVLEN